METLVNRTLSSLASVYFESGDHRSLLKVKGDDFMELLGGVRLGYFCEED